MIDTQEVCRKFVNKYVVININEIIQHFFDNPDTEEYQTLLDNGRGEPNYQEVAEDNGYFMSDCEVYLKDNLESFSSIEEACKSMGFKEISSDDHISILGPDGESFDDWADAAEAGDINAREEEGTGAWYLTNWAEDTYSDFEDCCNSQNFETDSPEVFEWWVVDQYLAGKLKEKGEVIFDFMDFEISHRVWGRTCTGQAILMDSCIVEIVEEEGLLKEEGSCQN